MELSSGDVRSLTFYYDLNFFANNRDTNSPQALGWLSRNDQEVRFKTLVGIGEMEGADILDVGCGFGDMYGFLSSWYSSFRYAGIDIFKKFISAASNKYPQGNFESKEVYEVPDNSFDYVFASGVFPLYVEDYMTKYMGIIKKMYQISNIGVAFNMPRLGSYGPGMTVVSYSPQVMQQLCEDITQKVEIVEGYAENDFTVYLRR